MNKRQFLITEDGSHTIYIPELDETYHSTHGAIRESTYVFIEQGLKYVAGRGSVEKIRIFEVGFGTGLNALLSALYTKKKRISMEYESIEAFPLNRSEVQKLNYAGLIKQFRSKEIFQKIHESPWGKWIDISSGFQLRKINLKLQDYKVKEQFDLCFFDAFAPSKQPEMWTKEILEKMYALLTTNGVLVTYCAKGQLKRDLKSMGFEVETLPGPPGKFEMVRAIKI